MAGVHFHAALNERGAGRHLSICRNRTIAFFILSSMHGASMHPFSIPLLLLKLEFTQLLAGDGDEAAVVYTDTMWYGLTSGTDTALHHGTGNVERAVGIIGIDIDCISSRGIEAAVLDGDIEIQTG